MYSQRVVGAGEMTSAQELKGLILVLDIISGPPRASPLLSQYFRVFFFPLKNEGIRIDGFKIVS